MNKIEKIDSAYYRVKLLQILTDSTHGVHDLHVHLLAAVPNKSYFEVHGFGLERYIADPLSIEESFATAPDTPGHGVVFGLGQT